MRVLARSSSFILRPTLDSSSRTSNPSSGSRWKTIWNPVCSKATSEGERAPEPVKFMGNNHRSPQILKRCFQYRHSRLAALTALKFSVRKKSIILVSLFTKSGTSLSAIVYSCLSKGSRHRRAIRGMNEERHTRADNETFRLFRECNSCDIFLQNTRTRTRTHTLAVDDALTLFHLPYKLRLQSFDGGHVESVHFRLLLSVRQTVVSQLTLVVEYVPLYQTRRGGGAKRSLFASVRGRMTTINSPTSRTTRTRRTAILRKASNDHVGPPFANNEMCWCEGQYKERVNPQPLSLPLSLTLLRFLVWYWCERCP